MHSRNVDTNTHVVLAQSALHCAGSCCISEIHPHMSALNPTKAQLALHCAGTCCILEIHPHMSALNPTKAQSALHCAGPTWCQTSKSPLPNRVHTQHLKPSGVSHPSVTRPKSSKPFIPMVCCETNAKQDAKPAIAKLC